MAGFALLQADAWWSSGWLWWFILALVIAILLLLPRVWQSPRHRP